VWAFAKDAAGNWSTGTQITYNPPAPPQITVQTGGVSATGFGFGAGVAGLLGLSGLLLAIGAIRRREYGK